MGKRRDRKEWCSSCSSGWFVLVLERIVGFWELTLFIFFPLFSFLVSVSGLGQAYERYSGSSTFTFRIVSQNFANPLKLKSLLQQMYFCYLNSRFVTSNRASVEHHALLVLIIQKQVPAPISLKIKCLPLPLSLLNNDTIPSSFFAIRN